VADKDKKVSAYLGICAIYRDEAPYLREWIEFHRLVGAERFFLYNNLSTDSHREALAPYVSQGVATVHNWPQEPGMVSAYNDCLATHRDDARWIAFLDVDEFLLSPDGRPVSELLTEFERWPGVGVNRATFGTSGHRTKPKGLVIENYLWRGPDSLRTNHGIKSIVDPKLAEGCQGAHFFTYREGSAVDEHQKPIPGGRTESVSMTRLRINHYWIKSEEEFRYKQLNKPRAHTDEPRANPPREKLDRKFNAEEDRVILSYLPELKQRLEEITWKWGPVNGDTSLG
jgi:hypothetical protein